MNVIFVVHHPRDFPCAVPGADVVSASTYLTDPGYGESRHAQVLNLCRADRYQGRGYYVSLLAEARGHRPLPEVKAIRDVQSNDFDHLLTEETRALAQQALSTHDDETCDVDSYFGRDPKGKTDSLCQQLFAQLRIPLLRASFERRNGEWQLGRMRILSAADIPSAHHHIVVDAAVDYIGLDSARVRKLTAGSPSVAILHNKDEPDPPSNAEALRRFVRAAEMLGMHASFIGRNDIERLAEFDALFIRDTTRVNHYTYQFARRAAAEGLVVIDDPESILKCNNKVYLNELLTRHHVPMPKTLTVHRDNIDHIVPLLGLPCVLKQPDSAFSIGVEKIHSQESLRAGLDKLLAKSELIVAQEWLPTTFDWRVAIFDRRPLFVCKYFMAPGHWQVIKREPDRRLEGSTAALTVGETPEIVVQTALRAANLIGDGLYGVDLKEANNQCYVMEVNENPNVDAGNEDGVLGDALYREMMGVFLRRIQERARVGA
jgi:glutathione synthase/RimK-type ligase-like ATP-grasp enzyme